MIAFFCSTPYQILLAINIKFTILKGKDVDIYVLNHFQQSNEAVERLKKINLFNKVEHINSINFTDTFNQRGKVSNFYRKIMAFISYKKITNQYFTLGETVYEEVYFTYPDVIIQLVIKELYNRNKSLKINLYEDGTGGYSSTIISPSIYKRFFNIMFGYGKTNDRYDSIFLLKPELYASNTKIQVRKILDINIDDTNLKKIINTAYDYKDHYKINEKIIFLEQPYSSNALNRNIKSVAEQILGEDYIVKLHPRSTTEMYKSFNIYKNNSVPWEVINLNNDIENKILISYYSTACFSSKILFDKEPTIILLYNLKEIPKYNLLSEDNLKFVGKFKGMYRDDSKIFIPNDLKELKEYINKVLASR